MLISNLMQNVPHYGKYMRSMLGADFMCLRLMLIVLKSRGRNWVISCNSNIIFIRLIQDTELSWDILHRHHPPPPPKSLQSCPTLCDPIRRQPTRLPRPWDSPGKNTGVGCHFLLQCMKVESESEVAQLCLTLSDPMDCSLPGSSIHGIFQARVLEWGAIAFSYTGILAIINNWRKSEDPSLQEQITQQWKSPRYPKSKTEI